VGSGLVTTAQRVAIANALATGGKQLDYKVLALQFATATYALDSYWNVYTIYAETGDPISIELRRFTDTTFASLDPGTTTRYLIGLNPDNYLITSGSFLAV
jgi:hypothetical protein